MSGELWRSFTQFGVETTYGTAVAATRRMYFQEPTFGREREARAHRFATGSRDNVRAFTLGPQEVSGELRQPLSASELIELLLMGIKGAVTPTQPDGAGAPSVYLWTFTPGNTLDSATIEWHDGADAWQSAGCYVDSLRVNGSANGANEVTASVFGKGLTSTTMTAALSERTPDFIEGWETKLYLDAFEGTPGSTEISDTLINWDITINNQLARKFFANNSNEMGAATIGELGVEATLTFEAAAAQAATEFTNWDAATKRLARLEFGENETIESTYNKFVTIDIPGAWSAFELGQTDEGTRVYQLSKQYVYDPTNAYGVQVRCQNDRSAAW